MGVTAALVDTPKITLIPLLVAVNLQQDGRQRRLAMQGITQGPKQVREAHAAMTSLRSQPTRLKLAQAHCAIIHLSCSTPLQCSPMETSK